MVLCRTYHLNPLDMYLHVQVASQRASCKTTKMICHIPRHTRSMRAQKIQKWWKDGGNDHVFSGKLAIVRFSPPVLLCSTYFISIQVKNIFFLQFSLLQYINYFDVHNMFFYCMLFHFSFNSQSQISVLLWKKNVHGSKSGNN